VGRLRRRLDKLQEKSGYQRTTLICPVCSEEFDVVGDVALQVVVAQWLRGPEGSSGHGTHADTWGETPEDIRRLFDHEHEVGAFLDKGSGLPFLSKAAGGFDLREVPERSCGDGT